MQKTSRAFRRSTSYYIEFRAHRRGDTEGLTVTRPDPTAVHAATRLGFRDRRLTSKTQSERPCLRAREYLGPLQDLRQIFAMAIAEGHIRLNPADLLFTPKEARRPKHPVMIIPQIGAALRALALRERMIAKLAIIAGMRPGEIFALTWGRVSETYAEVRQRVYRGLVDTPKTHHSERDAALADGVVESLEQWRESSCCTSPSAFVFPSERGTALSKDNVWRRNMQPKLAAVGLGWCNFQVMRRTHATLMRHLKADPKLVADQLVHSVDVSLNVYAQSPVEGRLALVNELESLLIE